MSSLFVIQGKDQGQRFELDAPQSGLGRDKANAVSLHDSEVSRQHAEIRREGDAFALVDLGSSNGTYVNSQRIERHVLRSGDRVQIGRTLMIFTSTEETPSHNQASRVDIVGAHRGESGSRIVKAISQEEGSRIFGSVDDSQSPWLARARSNLQIMYRTALAVSHTLDIDQLLHRVLELIFEWVESDRGCIMLVDPESGELVPKVRRNRKGVSGEDRILISRTILDYVMERKEGVLTSDARDDQRWDPAGSIVKLGVREAICVPMQGRYGVVGLIYIDTYTPPGQVIQHRGGDNFSEEHLKLMIAIGHQAALAVEDTSYYSAMVQAERLAAIGQTITTLSHHIKNILQGIRGGSYLIEEGLKSGDADVARRGWKIVERNQERISSLVLDMLTFSKERSPDMTPADINAIGGDVVELVQARAKEAEIDFVWQPGADIPTLTFDPEGLHRAILNVVTNAIDACEKQSDGRIVVGTQYCQDEGLVRITVDDNGTGIAPEDISKIFSMFESKKGARGTGLGLPVSQKIMQEHGGNIRVESTPDQGSRFILELPAVFPELGTSAEMKPGATV